MLAKNLALSLKHGIELMSLAENAGVLKRVYILRA